MNGLYDSILAIEPAFLKSVIQHIQNDNLVDTDAVKKRNEEIATMMVISPEGSYCTYDEFCGRDEGEKDERIPEDIRTRSDGLVAVIPIEGMMMKRSHWWYYSTGTQQVIQMIKMANDDPSIYAIVFLIESGGGTVAGTYELGEAIRQSAKPTIAVKNSDTRYLKITG